MGLPLANHTIQVVETPFGPLDPGYPERFFELRTWQMQQLPADCTYGVLWDDDHLLEDEPEFLELIKKGAADLIYGTRLFFWGSHQTYTTHLPVHRSLFAWRHHPGDRIPNKFEGKPGPEIAHRRAKNIVDLEGKLLDYGYVSEEDRTRVWQEYKRVGKLDAYVLALVRKPQLHDWIGVTKV
jgi:hypothetical protein